MSEKEGEEDVVLDYTVDYYQFEPSREDRVAPERIALSTDGGASRGARPLRQGASTDIAVCEEDAEKKQRMKQIHSAQENQLNKYAGADGNAVYKDSFAQRLEARIRFRNVSGGGFSEVERTGILDIIMQARRLVQGKLNEEAVAEEEEDEEGEGEGGGGGKQRQQEKSETLVSLLEQLLKKEENHEAAWEWQGGLSSLRPIKGMLADVTSSSWLPSDEEEHRARQHDSFLRHIALIATDELNVFSICSGMGTDLQALFDNGHTVNQYVSIEHDEVCQDQIKRVAERNGMEDDQIMLLGDIWKLDSDDHYMYSRDYIWALDIATPFTLVFMSTPCQDSSGLNANRPQDSFRKSHRDNVRQKALELSSDLRSIHARSKVEGPDTEHRPGVVVRLGALLVSEFVKASNELGDLNDQTFNVKHVQLCPHKTFGYPITRNRLIHTELPLAVFPKWPEGAEKEKNDDRFAPKRPMTLTEIFQHVNARCMCKRCDDDDGERDKEDSSSSSEIEGEGGDGKGSGGSAKHCGSGGGDGARSDMNWEATKLWCPTFRASRGSLETGEVGKIKVSTVNDDKHLSYMTVEDAEVCMGFEAGFTKGVGCDGDCKEKECTKCTADRMHMIGNGVHLQVCRYVFQPLRDLFRRGRGDEEGIE